MIEINYILKWVCQLGVRWPSFLVPECILLKERGYTYLELTPMNVLRPRFDGTSVACGRMTLPQQMDEAAVSPDQKRPSLLFMSLGLSLVALDSSGVC